MESNGAGPRVQFGPGETDHLPVEWASAVLRMWRERQPAVFAAYLGEAIVGTAPRMRKERA